ncbi:MAG: hypothetical protein HY596_01805 [Candidatus Omnitrophica bacterium]|nr:hypothetical protein [Candidatus Omnitrophota bacterium]
MTLRASRVILVTEIHPVNAPIYWLLSFVVTVKTLYIHPSCARFMRRRVEQIDTDDYFASREDSWAFRARTFRAWEAIAARLPREPWQRTFRGLCIDFSTKAKQELGRAFDDVCLLQEIRRRHASAACAVVVHSSRSAWLATHAAPSPCFDGDGMTRRLSQFHVACDRLWEGWLNGVVWGRLFAWLIGGLAARLRLTRRTLASYRYLYWCDNVNELHVSSEKRSFTWLMDGVRIRPDDLLVIVPNPSDPGVPSLRRELIGTPYRVGTFSELYQHLSSRHLWRAMADVLGAIGRGMIQPVPGAAHGMVSRYLASVVKFAPLLDHVQPACFLETDSSLGVEEPAVVYLDKLGIATVMYNISAMLVFYTHPGGCEQHDFLYAHLLASRLVCWNPQAKRLFERHPQDERLTMTVLGPTMAGDERVLTQERHVLRRTYLHREDAPRETFTYVAVFDLPPSPKPLARPRQTCPYTSPYTEEYTVRFLEDMVRVLHEVREIVLVYKPKRGHLMPQRFGKRFERYHRLVEQLKGHDRAVVVDEDLNPWVPIVTADVCISLPGSTPVCAGWHLGVPGFFHDPTGQLGPEQHPSIRAYITHNYEGLKALIRRLHGKEDEAPLNHRLREESVCDFIGVPPGLNGNAAFRNFLGVLGGMVPQAEAMAVGMEGRWAAAPEGVGAMRL